jgi:protein-tyrosine-phosphatase
MAKALLAKKLDALGTTISVRSAALFGGGQPPPAEVVSAMAFYGIDVGTHRSTKLRAETLAEAVLIVGMEREHVRHVVVAAPQVWPQTFTLKELVRRGQNMGPRMPGEPLTHWLGRIHEGRDRWALLGDSPADDITDPIGGPQEAYVAAAAELDDLIGRLVTLSGGLSSAGLSVQS